MNKLEAFGYIAAQAARGDISFPTSVNAVLRLQLALDDPDCHVDEAIRLVLSEPQLAARTVALANTAAYGAAGGTQVSSVRAAVLRIGYRRLRGLVAALMVRQFGHRIADPLLRAKAEQLWTHSAQVAALAHAVARHVTRTDPDTALFAGIVHEIGGFYLMTQVVALYAPWVMQQLALHRLQATVLDNNPASARVLQKNGFEEEGAQRSAVVKFGELHDLRVFAKVRRSLDDATQTAQ